MRVTVVRPGELGAREAALWKHFQQATPSGASPLLSLGFAQVVDRVRRNARVAVVEDGATIELFLPFELGRARVARPIGWRVAGLQGVVGSGVPVDLSRVLRLARVRGWRFHHAPVEEALLAPHRYPGSVTRVPLVDLHDGWEAYLASRTNQLRRENRRRLRRLERELGPVAFEWHAPRPELLPLLIGWKSEQYATARSLYLDPGPRLIVEALASETAEDCTGGMSVLSAGGRPIALHFGLLGPGFLCSLEVAYDPELARHAPGIMLWLALAEEAAGRGVGRIDLGYGTPERNGRRSYKLDLANGAYAVAGGAVWATGAEAALRRLYRQVAACA